MGSLGERSGVGKGKACRECSRRCSLLHGKGETDPCLSSFFKIMFGERFSEFLFFPPNFVPMVAGFVKQGALLKDANGGRWRVEFAKVDGALALGKGWGDFVKHHDLVLGDLVVFHLVESHFEVRMYGRTACEKLNVAQESDKKQAAHKSYGVGCGSHDFNNEKGNMSSETEKLQGQQCKVVNEKGCRESKVKKKKRSSGKSFRIPARNEGTVIDLTDENEISRNGKSKRASDVELQQSKLKCPKKDHQSSTDITRNRNGLSVSATYSNPHHLFNGECSTGKVQQTRSAQGCHKVEATAKNLDSAAAKLEGSQVLEKKHGGELTLKYKSCGKNKVAATWKLDNEILERSNKLVTGFAKENLSNTFSIPSTVIDLGLRAARTGKRLSGREVDLMQMKVGSTCSRARRTEMVPMAVQPTSFGSNPPTPISAQISYIIPNETRTHLDLSPPLPMLGERLVLLRTVVMLKDPNSRLWPVLYLRTSTTQVALEYGWEAFADAHHIRARDECIFSVDNCSEGVYAVHVIRHHLGELAG